MKKTLLLLLFILVIVACTKEEARQEVSPTIVQVYNQKPIVDFVSGINCQNGKVHLILGNSKEGVLNVQDIIFTANKVVDKDAGCEKELLFYAETTECLSIDDNGKPLSGKVDLVVDAQGSSSSIEVNC